MKLAPALFALCLCIAPFGVARAQTPPATASLPRAGEIALEGRVTAVGDGQFTLEVVAFTNPNGKRALLPAPRPRTITSDATNLKIGELVTVVGADNGATLRAREIIRAAPTGAAPTDAPSAQKPAQFTPPAVAEKPLETAPPAQAATLPALPLLPPAFVAGGLTITLVQAGFEYVERLFRGRSTFERTPVFTCTFEVSGARPATQTDIVLRRIIGPQNQFVGPSPFANAAFEVAGQPHRLGLYNTQIDPNWEWLDMDLDIAAAPGEPQSGGKIDLGAVTLPAPGQEKALNRNFAGKLGTQFTAVKIARDQTGKAVLLVHHQKPAAPADLTLDGYSYTYQSGNNAHSGSGGLDNKTALSADSEITLTTNKNLSELRQLVVSIGESAPSLKNRATVQRRRLRFPLRALRAAQKIVPLDPRVAPEILGRASAEGISVVVESDGQRSSKNTRGILLWTQPPPDAVTRGIRWKPASTEVKFNDNTPPFTLRGVFFSPQHFLWHGDATPIAPGETVQQNIMNVPAAVTQYDLKIKLEGRVVVEESFERAIEVPSDNGLQTPFDDGDHSLILRKVQRYSKTENPDAAPYWQDAPANGITLVFEINPLLIDAEYEVSAFDSEDEAGRKLKLTSFGDNRLVPGDLTQHNKGASKFYSVIVSPPAPDAKRLVIWLRAVEKARKTESATIEIPGVAVARDQNN